MPNIAKQYRPTTNGNRAHTTTTVRILERSGEVWRSEEVGGPHPKNPFDGPITARKSHEDGSGQGQPLDPPDANTKLDEDSCSSGATQAANLGENERERTTTDSSPPSGDVSMGEATAGEKEVEEVCTTQFLVMQREDNVFCWNCCRARSEEFLSEMKEFNRLFKPVSSS